MECVILHVVSYEAGYMIIVAYNNDNLRLKHATSGVQNFPKNAGPTSKICAPIRWHGVNLGVEDLQISGVALEILAATAIWSPGHRNA